MNYEGKMVSHNKFGVGIIKRQEKDSVTIRFNNTCEERTFGFPRCLENSVQILDDRELLLSVLEKHGFEGFHHYTDFKNFIQIMKEKKLYSRNIVEEKQLLHTDAAENSVIVRTPSLIKDMVRFYYKENTPTLYRNEGIRHDDDFGRNEHNVHMPIPVLLLFEKELIFEPGVYITNGGGGSVYTQKTNDFNKALSYDWDGVFRRGPYGQVPPQEISAITNRRNAEFLYPNQVGIDRLSAIIFRSEADKKHAEFILGENDLFQVNPSKFTIQMFESRKRNFLCNYQIRKGTSKVCVEFLLLNSLKDYNHTIVIRYNDGTKKEMPLPYMNLNGTKFVFEYHDSDNISQVEYLLNNEVSAIWR